MIWRGLDHSVCGVQGVTLGLVPVDLRDRVGLDDVEDEEDLDDGMDKVEFCDLCFVNESEVLYE